MAVKANRKSGLDSNAAYAASQPLFDVLSNGINRLDEQRSNLTKAREIVQNLHVKIINETPNQGQSFHDQYMRSVVAAWQSASHVYADIFQQLIEVTAADPTEGRAATSHNSQFEKIFRTAVDSKKVAEQFALRAKVSTGSDDSPASAGDEDSHGSEDDSDSSEDESDEGKVKNDLTRNNNGKRPLAENGNEESNVPNPPSKVSKKFEGDFNHFKDDGTLPVEPVTVGPGTTKGYVNGIKYGESGRELWRIGAKAPTVPYDTMSASERKAWEHERKRQVREHKIAVQRVKKHEMKRKAVENARAKEATGATKQGTIPIDESTGQPAVFYEDLSGEASARLQSKEDAKQAAKAEKAQRKRKRESADSNVQAPDLTDNLPDTAFASHPEKPDRKKSKKPDDTGAVKSSGAKRKRATEGEEPKPARKKNKDKYDKATKKLGKSKQK